MPTSSTPLPQHTPSDIYAATLALLEALTTVSSATGEAAGIRRCAEILATALSDLGLETTIDDAVGENGTMQPLLSARLGPPSDRPLLLIGHLDTVLPAWKPARRDGKLWASGAADMKGGLATLVGALRLLRRQGLEPPADLAVTVVPDEEVLGPVTVAAMRDRASTARGVWVLEPGKRCADGGETLVGGRRGMLHWRLTASGRGAHAGNDYWHGRSALVAAAEWAAAAADRSRPDDGPTVNPGRLIAGDADLVDDPALAVGLVGTARRLNAVPDRAIVEGEARFLRRADGEQLIVALRQLTAEIAERRDVALVFTHDAPIPPLEPSAAGQRWAAAAVTIAAEQGWRLEVERNRGGLSFPNLLPDPTAVPVLDGLGPTGGGLHTHDEFVDLVSLDRRIALLAALLAREA